MSRARILADYVSSGDELADKAPIASPTFTGTVAGVTKTHVGLSNVDNTSDSTKQAATLTAATKSDVGLSNVDNTTDALKPVSTATNTALGDKANKASPAFTGTPTGITATHITSGVLPVGVTGGSGLNAVNATTGVKPHIIPDVLYPAVAGKLSDGSTSHSGAYGTAQSDTRSYYYTDIKGSKPSRTTLK